MIEIYWIQIKRKNKLKSVNLSSMFEFDELNSLYNTRLKYVLSLNTGIY